MRSSPRVVLDTNVLISGTIVPHGFPARILALAVERRIKLVVSPYLLAEYLAVIQRPHISKKYPHLGNRLDLFRRFIISGDEHLLQLGRYHHVKILSPRDFVVKVLHETLDTPDPLQN